MVYKLLCCILLIVPQTLVHSLRDLRQLPNATSDEEIPISVPVASRISAGSTALKERYPYMCSLRTNGHLHKCGGVLIKSDWILTAAHCVDPMFPRTLGINPVTYIGGWDIDDDEKSNREIEVVRPAQTIMHPGWTGEVQDGNDLALLQLDSPSTHQPIHIIPLENELHTGQKLVAIGWGELQDGSPSRYLQQAVDLEFVSLKNCQKVPYAKDVGDGFVCAYADTQDTCKGDSGGPLILADHRMGDVNEGSPGLDRLVGITSFGPEPCAQTDLPSISTDAAFFRDWIMAIIDEGPPVSVPSPQKPLEAPLKEVAPQDLEEAETATSEGTTQRVVPKGPDDRQDIKFVVLLSEDDENQSDEHQRADPPVQESDEDPSTLRLSVPVPLSSPASPQPAHQSSPVSDTGTGTPESSTSSSAASRDSSSAPATSTSAPTGTSFQLSRTTWYSSSGGIASQSPSSINRPGAAPPRPPPGSWVVSRSTGSTLVTYTSRISTARSPSSTIEG